ncbi:MAG: M1 family metallopeptidase [Nitrospiraceae bacterium]
MNLFKRLLASFLLAAIQVVLLSPVASAAELPVAGLLRSNDVELLTHHLIVELDPDQHRLLATDRMVLKILPADRRHLSFSLNSGLHVTQVVEMKGKETKPLLFSTESEQRNDIRDGPQHVDVLLEPHTAADHTLTLEWRYEGVINDPPREPRHLRFVTPSETAGHIGPEGVYLSGETLWYPDLPGALSTYRVTITTPFGWQTVSHGRLAAETRHADRVTAEWVVTSKTEALTLVANRFVKRQRQWNGVAVITYLFADDAALAKEYLEASVKYLEIYTKLLGPYPFTKFAVVENFFASGLGMPSFTLLGSGVIKRHYVQSYALGHEIVHSWIGNWVFNDTEKANWVEGLTTYLANYYYEELMGTSEQARAQRRMMLLGYAVYVSSEDDYPVGRFRRKTDQKDNAIGYQKAAMIFHMLRREIGDDAFWRGIRKLIADFGESHASWDDVERTFSHTGQRDLRWFFSQWVERKGAPRLTLSDTRTVQVEHGGEKRIEIHARLIQKDFSFRLRLPVQIRMQDGQIARVELDVQSGDQTLTVSVPVQPISLEIDPDFDTFRRIDRQHLPPMLNLFVTDRERFIIVPEGERSIAREPYEDLITRMKSQDATSGAVVVKTDSEFSMRNGTQSLNGSVLVLGGPGFNRLAEWALGRCASHVHFDGRTIIVDDRTYEGPELSVLVSCRHPDHPDRVVTVFYGQTPSAAARVARLLFFYGWHSYMIFREGAVVARGDFLPEQRELEVRFDGS